jgi:phosphatidylglycerol:prolipoprotein diacylglycerol transferase
MIPYFELSTVPLPGGGSLAVFGTLVALGVFAGAAFAESRARMLGIPASTLHGAIGWALVPGLVLSHLAALLPQVLRSGTWPPGLVFAFWNGMSSFGGLAGAWLGLVVYCRRRRLRLLPLAEILLQALVVGWLFGRLGCTLVHDHIGRPSSFWLAIRFPGGARHDLGLYELLYTAGVLLPALFVLNRRPRVPGATVCWIALLYAPARFAGDFLRNTDLPGADLRYLGLTLAQYGCMALACLGLFFALRIRHTRPAPRAGPVRCAERAS